MTDVCTDTKQCLVQSMGSRWSELNERLFNLESVPNARELGGLPASGGRRVRQGRLIRSGELVHASDADLEFLSSELDVGLVIDLRTSFELQHHPDRRVRGAEYVNMPVMDKNNNIWHYMMQLPGSAPEQLRALARTVKGKAMTRWMYAGFVQDEFCQLQYAAFMQRLLAMTDDRPVLWHCSQGKDRTGLACAFLLFCLGCSRQTVVEDFALTNYYYQDLVDAATEQLMAEGGSEEDASVIQAMLGVRVDYFEAALDLIDTLYGTMEQYISHVLVMSDDDRRLLQERFLE